VRRRSPVSTSLPALALAFLIGLTVAGCASEEPTTVTLLQPDQVRASLPAQSPRVLLIGLDGGDWNVLQPLIDAGRMPTLQKLIAGGAHGDLESVRPMISPALWTTVMTGTLPDQHAIRDFVYKEPGSYAQPVVNATIRQRLALWNILSDLDRSVGIVDWYATFPAEEVQGFIVSDRIKTMGPDTPGVTYPVASQLSDSVAEPLPLGDFPALDRITRPFGSELPAGLDKALREDLHRYRLARDLYREQEPDLFAFYLKGLDALGHFYWKFHEPNPEYFGELDAAEKAALGPLIEQYYQLCDELIGDFLEGVDKETTVLIVSDHGFRAFVRPESLIFDVDRLFETLGWLEFEDPTLAADRTQRRVKMETTQAYTHEGTQIVSVFGQRERPVYLNVAGREPQGMIAAERYVARRQAMKQRLEALKTDLGTPVFAEIKLGHPDQAGTGQLGADLYLRVNEEIAFDHMIEIDTLPHSLFGSYLWEYGNISGTHRLQGILIASGPTIASGAKIENARLVDVMPTVLGLMGLPVAQDLDGRALESLWREPPGLAAVASYQDWIEARHPELDSAPMDEAYRERLRSLGYVQ